METLLAIAVVAVLLTTFLAVFGPATNTIRRAISIQDADRLSSALEKEMTTLERKRNRNQYDTAFDKAFQWISDSGSARFLSGSLQLSRRHFTTSPTENSNLTLRADGEPGKDYLDAISSAPYQRQHRPWKNLMEAVEGKVFVVSMRQLVRDSATGGLVPAEAGAPIVSAEGVSASDADSFEDAVIAYQADFYLLPANSYTYLTGPLSNGGSDLEQTLGTPVHTQAMSVLR